jgi:phosphoglycerate dehydrogenase-like enzyme
MAERGPCAVAVYDPELSREIAQELRGAGLVESCTAYSDPSALAAAIAGVEVLVSSPVAPGVLALGDRLRWVQSLSAGVETWLESPIAAVCPITRMVGVYEKYMAE